MSNVLGSISPLDLLELGEVPELGVVSQRMLELVTAGEVDPCLSRVFPCAGTAECHQLTRVRAAK